MRTIRRWWRGFRRGMRAPGVQFIYHQMYQQSLDWLPFDRLRGERILTFLGEEGLLTMARSIAG